MSQREPAGSRKQRSSETAGSASTPATADSVIWRGLYWVFAGGAVVLFCVLAYQRSHKSVSLLPVSDAAVISTIIALYIVGWGGRWLFTGRTDHLFSNPRHYKGSLEETRRSIAASLSFLA